MKSTFTGQAMVFAKELNGRTIYSVSISRKNQNDEWENASILINFADKPEIPNKTTVDIKNAWLTFYFKKDSKIPVFYLFCNDYEILDKPDVVEGFAALSDDEIPF